MQGTRAQQFATPVPAPHRPDSWKVRRRKPVKAKEDAEDEDDDDIYDEPSKHDTYRTGAEFIKAIQEKDVERATQLWHNGTERVLLEYACSSTHLSFGCSAAQKPPNNPRKRGDVSVPIQKPVARRPGRGSAGAVATIPAARLQRARERAVHQ